MLDDVGCPLIAGGEVILARPLSCRTVRHNRNVCVPLTLERQSVNVLTCEFAHRIQGCGKACHVSWGEKEGGDEEPDRPGRPTQREQHGKPESNPTTRTQPTEPATTEQAPANTRPNLSDQRGPQPRPQVENNPTETQPARQATRKTSPPPPEKNCAPQNPASRQPPPSNRGTTRTKNHRTPGGRGRELRRDLKGVDPRTSHRPPTRSQTPSTRHRHPPETPAPRTRPRPETKHQSQDPHHPPVTPPPTPHQVPCTHAMDHIQPTPTLANKLEQNQETSSRKSEIQMPGPRPSGHPTSHQ